MDNQFQNKIQEKLKQELETAEKRLSEINTQDPYSDPSRLNDNAASDVEASEESDHDRLAALKAELLANIERVTKAMKKISDGVYGKCEKCGSEIDEKRLEVFPEAVYCFDCERHRE